MRTVWLLIMMMSLAGCGRDWSLPGFSDTGCTTDADCLYGICSAGLCDETRCRENDDCRYGLCDANVCNSALCLEDDDCYPGTGICVDGKCDVNKCHTDDDCVYGLCLNGDCDMNACHFDTDCSMGFICSGGGPTEVGTCVPDTGEGPPLDGDPHALRMTDNLENAILFVKARHPEAFFLKAVGISLKADGTVDIMYDYSSRWDYAFQDGDGINEPATYVTVTYLKMAGEAQGLYEPEAGNVSEGLEVPETDWRAFKDATELVGDFLQEPGCVAPAQESGDSIVYNQTETGPQFILGNWRGQNYMGDPVTGEATAYCQ
jgi:hypothetical protein